MAERHSLFTLRSSPFRLQLYPKNLSHLVLYNINWWRKVLSIHRRLILFGATLRIASDGALVEWNWCFWFCSIFGIRLVNGNTLNKDNWHFDSWNKTMRVVLSRSGGWIIRIPSEMTNCNSLIIKWDVQSFDLITTLTFLLALHRYALTILTSPDYLRCWEAICTTRHIDILIFTYGHRWRGALDVQYIWWY